MKRSLFGLIVAAVAAIGFGGVGAFASEGSVHFGPIASGSADSGTCGNDWANDTYTRMFEASTTRNADGTYSASESFIAGRFETIAGSSPGACEESGVSNGGTVAADVTGTFKGNYQMIVSGGTFNPAATCDVTTCGTTAAFVATVYGEGATYSLLSWGFTYHANGPLLDRDWVNSSAGNFGDIRSA